MNMSFDELFQWLSVSEEVTNVLMALEAVLMWHWYQHFLKSGSNVEVGIVKAKLVELSGQRAWPKLPSLFRKYQLALFSYYGGYLETSSLASPTSEGSLYSTAIDLYGNLFTNPIPFSILSEHKTFFFLST